MISVKAALPEVIRVRIAINVPMNATVSPVIECVTRSTTARRNIIVLIANPLLLLIASEGFGYVEGSIAFEDAALSSFLQAK